MIHTRPHPVSGNLEMVSPTGSQIFAPYEANLVAQCEQRRLSIAKSAAEKIAGVRAEINRVDTWLMRDNDALSRVDLARNTETDPGRFEAPWPVWAYWLIMVAIATLEIWVNKLAFDHTASDNIGSLALAAIVSAVMFLLGKFTAKLLRQKPWQQGDWTAVWLALACNLLILGLAWFVGMARQTMAAEIAVSKGHALVPGLGFGFGMIILLGYGAMLFASYWFIDPSDQREQYDARTANLRPRVDRLYRERERLARQHNKLIATTRLDQEGQIQDCFERIMQYRDGNMQRNEKAPAYFRKAVPTEVFKPLNLGEMIDVEPRIAGAAREQS